MALRSNRLAGGRVAEQGWALARALALVQALGLVQEQVAQVGAREAWSRIPQATRSTPAGLRPRASKEKMSQAD